MSGVKAEGAAACGSSHGWRASPQPPVKVVIMAESERNVRFFREASGWHGLQTWLTLTLAKEAS